VSWKHFQGKLSREELMIDSLLVELEGIGQDAKWEDNGEHNEEVVRVLMSVGVVRVVGSRRVIVLVFVFV
jgi:hypothetical protein